MRAAKYPSDQANDHRPAPYPVKQSAPIKRRARWTYIVFSRQHAPQSRLLGRIWTRRDIQQVRTLHVICVNERHKQLSENLERREDHVALRGGPEALYGRFELQMSARRAQQGSPIAIDKNGLSRLLA